MPNHTDIRVQSETLPMGDAPKGEGWKLWSGNSTYNEWYRIVRIDYEGKVDAVLIHNDNWFKGD